MESFEISGYSEILLDASNCFPAYDTETSESETESSARRDEIVSDFEDTIRERVCPVGRETKSCIFFFLKECGFC